MKTAFNKIEELLKDPFFEIKWLGKEGIRQRIVSLDNAKFPDNIRFEEWTQEDSRDVICYSFMNSEIGRLLIANSSKGVCFLGFVAESESQVLADFKHRFPQHQFKEELSALQQQAADYCNGNQTQTIILHLKGTDFQLNIWKKLVRIPEGKLATYGSLVPSSGSAQATGSAVGANPVSYIIPCHRVVKNDGSYQGYHWGSELKKLLLVCEISDYTK